MVSEYVVERSRSNKTRRPDIVLFVNGIPLAVIENKKAATDVLEGSASPSATKSRTTFHSFMSMHFWPNKNNNRYGTTGTPRKLWNEWREKQLHDLTFKAL